MKRILFIHQTAAIGGGSFCMLNVIKELDKSLFDIEVLLPCRGPLREELSKIGIKVHILPGLRGIPYNRDLWQPRFFVSYIKAFAGRSKVKKILEARDYDIVYLNSMVLYPLLKVVKSLHTKTIIHIREHWPLNEHKLQLSYAQRQVEKYSDALLAINRYSSLMFPDSEYKCNIAYDWIDMNGRYEYRPYKDIFGEDVSHLKVYLYTGGFDQFKGPKEVLTAFHHIKDPKARLLVLGEPPSNPASSYISSCCDIIKSDNRIVCIPRTYKLKHIVEQAYCVLSAFTIPHANLGLAEAIILKKIVVAADNDEAKEYSDGGKLALLYTANDSTDFEKKILMVDTNYPKLLSLLEKDSHIIKDLFDKNRNVNIISSTLKSL